jgi:hypothetical protein
MHPPKQRTWLRLRRGRFVAPVIFDPSKNLYAACRAPSVQKSRGIGLRKFDHAIVRNLEPAV